MKTEKEFLEEILKAEWLIHEKAHSALEAVTDRCVDKYNDYTMISDEDLAVIEKVQKILMERMDAMSSIEGKISKVKSLDHKRAGLHSNYK